MGLEQWEALVSIAQLYKHCECSLFFSPLNGAGVAFLLFSSFSPRHECANEQVRNLFPPGAGVSGQIS